MRGGEGEIKRGKEGERVRERCEERGKKERKKMKGEGEEEEGEKRVRRREGEMRIEKGKKIRVGGELERIVERRGWVGG